jgi:hypothetical protein
MDRDHPDWDFLAHQSQRGQSYTFTRSNGWNNHPPSEDDNDPLSTSPNLLRMPSPDMSAAPVQEALVNFVDAVANNYSLDGENRAELHSFLEVSVLLLHDYPSDWSSSQLATAEPVDHLKLGLIGHATALQTQQMVREILSVTTAIQETVKKLEENAAQTFSSDQIVCPPQCQFFLTY